MMKMKSLAAFGIVIVAAALATPAAASGVHVDFSQSVVTVHPGQEFTLEVKVFQADSKFNAFDAEVDFNPARLTNVPLSPIDSQVGPLMLPGPPCGAPFHRFVQHPSALEIHVGILCNQTFVTGPGVIYRIKFRASSTDTGTTVVSFGPAPSTAFFDAGVTLALETHSVTVVVTSTATGVSDRSPDRFSMASPLPNPRVDGRPGRFGFTLPRAGTVELDLFDAGGRVVGHVERRSFGAGPHAVELPANDLSAGTYFARMTTGWGESQWKRWVVLR
jgi:hypothetical protein